MDPFSTECFAYVDRLSAVSGAQAAKIDAVLHLARPLLGDYQEHSRTFWVGLAAARGHFATAERILSFCLHSASDRELERLSPTDVIDALAANLGAVADYLTSSESRTPAAPFGGQTAELIARFAAVIVDELRYQAAALLVTDGN